MEVYPEGAHSIRENHPGLIPISEKLTKKQQRDMNMLESDMAMRTCCPLQTHSHEM